MKKIAIIKRPVLGTKKLSQKTGLKINNKAFTLVELIVTITILAILGIIGFISFQSYTIYARDTVRVTDLNNIKSVLEYSYTESGLYPIPDDAEEVTYSGSTAWYQGNFGKKTRRATKRLNNVPTDPLTENKYTYSKLKNGNEYELGAVFEGDEVVTSPQPSTLKGHQGPLRGEGVYADSSNFKAYVSGNYNGKVLKVKTGSTDYILAVPSIILSDYTELKLEDIINHANSKFVLKGFKNLPASYGMKNTDTQNLDFLKKENFVVFSGKLKNLSESGTLQEQLGTNLALAYSGTTIENNSGIKEIVESNEGNKLFLTQNIIKNTIIPKFEVTAKVTNNYCGSKGTINTAHANFVTGTPAQQNQAWQDSDSNAPCYYSCINNYTGTSCGTAPVYASCKEILDAGASTGDGVYIIDPENNGTGFQVYCDMTTDGGGWTLVAKMGVSKRWKDYVNENGTLQKDDLLNVNFSNKTQMHNNSIKGSSFRIGTDYGKQYQMVGVFNKGYSWQDMAFISIEDSSFQYSYNIGNSGITYKGYGIDGSVDSGCQDRTTNLVKDYSSAWSIGNGNTPCGSDPKYSIWIRSGNVKGSHGYGTAQNNTYDIYQSIIWVK